MKVILVSAVALVDPDGRVLLAQRPEGKAMAGLWEFPGGKIDGDETPHAALLRELKEELNMVVTKASPLMQITHDYPDKKVSLDIWTVTEFNGLPVGVEGQEIRWVSLQDLPNFEFPEANQAILGQLSPQN